MTEQRKTQREKRLKSSLHFSSWFFPFFIGTKSIQTLGEIQIFLQNILQSTSDQTELQWW